MAGLIPQSLVCIGMCVVAACISCRSQVLQGQEPALPTQLKADYAADLPRIPHLEPHAALRAFDVLPGYRVELVAAEPLVMDPVAFSFDARGRLWIVEMRDYSELAEEKLGRVALLEDRDGDGQMDARTTFVEGLSWPTAIACWRDGVIVAEPPHLWFLRDQDGDGVCDARENWSTGFQRSNVQGLVNSLRWTVSANFHGATSSNGAELTGIAAQPMLTLRGRDFQLDPLLPRIVPASGGGQHGLSFNRWGDKFVTSNSDHLQQVLAIDRYRRSATAVDFPSARRSIAIDGPQAEVFRSSPIEPWRIVRTQLRASGLVPGLVEGGGRAAGYFTGATGTCILDAELGFGPDPNEDVALVCDVGSNLVHRKRLIADGVFFKAERIDAGTEFLRSRDIWFRPVQLGDGPDGCLYIADMYREVIEHPKSLPPMIKQHLDLNSGNDRGRIWRVVPTERNAIAYARDLTRLSDPDLVTLLAHPLSWQRLTASRLLLERGSIVVPEIQKFLMDLPVAVAWPLGMHLLEKFNAISEEILQLALGHPHPRVQQHALLVLESSDPALQTKFVDRIQSLTSSAEGSLRLQVALSVQRFPKETRLPLLASLMKHDPNADQWITAAVANSVTNAQELVTLCESAFPEQELPSSWLMVAIQALGRDVPSQAIDSENPAMKRLTRRLEQPGTRRIALGLISEIPNRAVAEKLILRLFGSADVADEIAKGACQRGLLGEKATSAELFTAARWARLADVSQAIPCLEGLLHPSRSQAVQAVAIETLAWRGQTEDLSLLLGKLPQLTSTNKTKAWNAITERQIGLNLLSDALENKTLSASVIAPDQQLALRSHPRETVRTRFSQLLLAPSREEVTELMKRYSAVLSSSESKTVAASGKEVFSRVCASCHRLGNVGTDVGPVLGGNIREKTPDQLLLAILDPSREVDPKFMAYTAELDDGRVFTGLLEEENAENLILKVPGGQRHQLLRSELESLRQSGKSLMPEGIEQQVNPEEMRSLLSFLREGL